MPSGRCPGAGYSEPVLRLVLELGSVVDPEPVPEALTGPELVPLTVSVRDADPVDAPVELVPDEQPHKPNPTLQEMIAALKRYF